MSATLSPRRRRPWRPTDSSPGKPCPNCAKPTCPTQDGRRRGLCRACYKRPEVRALYPAAHGNGRGHNSARRLPAEPTRLTPGTPEKLAVMIERHARGEQLHHPRDLRLYDATAAAEDSD